MNKLGIVLDNIMPTETNKAIIDKLNNIYKTNNLLSINIFVKNINWPYKKVEYGVFKLLDYQNFNGPTIVTNLELLSLCESIPNNSKFILYCFDFPWACNFPLKNGLKYLTSNKYSVYCKYPYIKEMLNTFGVDSKVSEIEDVIDGVLNV